MARRAKPPSLPDPRPNPDPEAADGPPGESLRPWLAELGWHQSWLAAEAGFSKKHLNQIINGKAGIGRDVAELLEKVTRVPTEVWMTCQAAWDVRDKKERHLGH